MTATPPSAGGAPAPTPVCCPACLGPMGPAAGVTPLKFTCPACAETYALHPAPGEASGPAPGPWW